MAKIRKISAKWKRGAKTRFRTTTILAMHRLEGCAAGSPQWGTIGMIEQVKPRERRFEVEVEVVRDTPNSTGGNDEPLLEVATVVDQQPRRSRPPIRRFLHAIDAAWQGLFGAVSLIVGLAVLTTLPMLQFLSLGYLLEASGRIARTGRFTAGFVGLRKAGRIGSIVLGAWLLLWLPRLASSLWIDSRLIVPESRATRFWAMALVVLTAWVILHTAAACLRGGRLRHFLWPRPIRFVRRMLQPGAYGQVRDAVWDFVAGLRLPYYFWLGLRGFVGGFLWLALPVSLLALGAKAPLVGFLGGILLAVVVLYLPFLQAEFAAQNRFAAMFALRDVRRAYSRAPVAFCIAVLFTLALALPLYLLKIELIPREAAWLPSLLFVMSIFPARLLSGWAIARARRREKPTHGLFRWGGRLAIFPVAGVYVLLVYFTQYLSWHGIWSLYEQHAFLVPAPFLGG